MKLLIRFDRIVGTATDAYTGPEATMDAPPGFDPARTDDYRLVDGKLLLPAPKRHITKESFRARFTMSEHIKYELSMLDDPAKPIADRQKAALLRARLSDQLSATYIDLDLQHTRDGVMLLEQAGILDAAGRALQILDAPVQPWEAWHG